MRIDREHVKRVLTMDEDTRKKFNAVLFMAVPLSELKADELRGLFVWVVRNRHNLMDGFGLDGMPAQSERGDQ